MDGAATRPSGVASRPSGGGQAKSSATSPARDYRIRHRTDYLRIQKSNVRVTSRHFVYLLAPGQRSDCARVGITVSRRIGTAVVRNRARRLVRESLRRLSGFVPTGVDMIVVVRCPPGQMRMQDALAEMQGVAKLIDRRGRALLSVASAPDGAQP